MDSWKQIYNAADALSKFIKNTDIFNFCKLNDKIDQTGLAYSFKKFVLKFCYLNDLFYSIYHHQILKCTSELRWEMIQQVSDLGEKLHN